MILNATCSWDCVLYAVYSLLDPPPPSAPAFNNVIFSPSPYNYVFICPLSFFDSLILCYVCLSVCFIANEADVVVLKNSSSTSRKKKGQLNSKNN